MLFLFITNEYILKAGMLIQSIDIWAIDVEILEIDCFLTIQSISTINYLSIVYPLFIHFLPIFHRYLSIIFSYGRIFYLV